MRSESIEKLAEALAAAQAQMGGARKDAQNPHFKSRYADLASIWEACRAPLTSNGLSVAQTTRIDEGGALALVTTLLHTSGQWMAGELPILADPRNPQAVGSWLTYSRRYALAAIAGIAPEDDDGEAAAAAQERPQARQERPRGRGRPDAPAAHRNGRGRTPDGAPDRAAVNEQFPARAETWSQFIGARLRQANGEWLREMTREGVAPDVRQEHRELTNEPRTVNALCTRLVELGKLDAATIAKGTGKEPSARDPEKARDAVKWFFDSSPKAIKAGVEKYLAKKLDEGRAALGMPDPDAHEPAKGEAVKAGSGAPPPGKGDAYEGEIEEALSN